MTAAPTQAALVAAFVGDTEGLADEVARVEVGRRLVAGYAEPWRSYHGLAHVEHVVAAARRGARAVGVEERPVVLAAWWHDVVMDVTDPRPGVDEEASAVDAHDTLAGWGHPELGREVGRLVRLTIGHAPGADDLAGAALVDADLAALGGDAEVYERYRAGVRTEYGHVSDEHWRLGRATVLRRLLDLPAVFHLPGSDEAERRARANLTAELASLTD